MINQELIKNTEKFDVIVVGGGHAGTEAALAAAKLGAKTLLLSHNLETIGQMSCNPAIGGIGKGHLVKEIDALGGAMGQAIDAAGIHFRVLNRSKGLAVQASRAQADRGLYKQAIRSIIEKQENLRLFQQPVDELLLKNNQVKGVLTQGGIRFWATTVILTTGTFLAGKIHLGKNNYSAGRAGDPAAEKLALELRQLPFRFGRLKTGTPPRIDSRTIDYSKLLEQPSELVETEGGSGFSYWGRTWPLPRQVSCYIAHTNETTHRIIRDNLTQSAMYGGMIEGVGPRYCPSIEDKIVKFADKTRHQIFIEPEGLDVVEVYPNGISTSLPYAVQREIVHSIVGLEQAHITRPGYAIEYDFFDPRDLYPTLESKIIDNLFFAGQINGTTGYEEAAAQGLIAGINAAQKVAGKAAWSPGREEAYIGVLLDDLVVNGTNEPYRMFTSRAEYRLLLREDNADLRLCPTAIKLGILSTAQQEKFSLKQQQLQQLQEKLENCLIYPHTAAASRFAECFGQALTREYRLVELLKRPNVHWQQLLTIPEINGFADVSKEIADQIETQIKYAGYVQRQEKEILQIRKQEKIKLPIDLDYNLVAGLSNEVKEKLALVKPSTLGQASRISGVTPAAIALLQIYLKRHGQQNKPKNKPKAVLLETYE